MGLNWKQDKVRFEKLKNNEEKKGKEFYILLLEMGENKFLSLEKLFFRYNL